MKKILLFAAAAFAVNTVYAGTNKVVNGDFEAPGYVQSVPSGYTWDPWDKQNNLSELPGWMLSTGGEWNGVLEILTGDDWMGDGLMRPDDDLNVLRFVGYNDNGWTNVAVNQIVENLTPGAEYTLDYLVAARFPSAEECGGGWAPDPNFGYTVSEYDGEVDDNNNPRPGKEIKTENLAGRSEWENASIDMFHAGTTFTAPANGKVYLNIYMANNYAQNNKHDNLWMLVDMVNVSSEGDAGVAGVIAEENAPVEYFNLQGIRVANPENGIFVRRQGNKVEKVVL